MSPTLWHQHNVVFPHRRTAQQVIAERIGPTLELAQEADQLTGWWFMNKQPWPLRYRAAQPSELIETLLTSLVHDGTALAWHPAIYEPETDAFGGPHAMATAHQLFHHDSRHLLAQHHRPALLGRRETAALLASSMMRAAGLDWYEQGDVWAKVAALRPTAPTLAPERATALTSAMRALMTTEPHRLCRPGRPLDGHSTWVDAFEEAGATLADLGRCGQLTRGLRAVIAHHVIFHANRAGLPLDDQSALSHIAREAIMGSSDNTASTNKPTPTASSVDTVTTDATTTPAADAEQLRNALVDQLQADGHARTPAVAAALRNVPRHLFVPDAPLEDAYANTPVHIKYDTDGTSISCASQPEVVALMLDQLDVQPGQNILELGAGTGYNAALLAHLVGEHGHVTTIDVDEDLVQGARAHLAAAGYSNVEALTRDGAVGHASGAPYDRIIATVGAHGVPHAWTQQLARGGRLLTPQRLTGSVSRSIAYEHHEGRWISVDSAMNTFMPLRKGIADDDRQTVPLAEDGTVRLQAPAGHEVDIAALAGVLAQPRTTQTWTGVLFRAMESPEWMELFVSCSVPSGLFRMLFPPSAKGTLLTSDPYPSSTAAVEEGALTYLARRLSQQTTPDGGKLWEFGVIGHGPGSEDLAAIVAEAIRTWDRLYRDRQATFEIQPLDAPADPPCSGHFTLATPLNRIAVAWH
ncbi:methyltransferase, FxLD system [Actinacidiphila glaucinigra]|uniref:Protein-L-isoaspartate O-methyltransferase n=1 Tax=Actinacidiphila glaucinigra TaxID=235986 RepID=A0A239LUX7_9ACTN|nr:methyltransferase, FxLD system [Actinacidiphila glaucinigra]SNT33509.1 protein-L-isoaspartate(D-aspartate) O-methyltransferase [Actinacidiphila glaucinigra]